MNQEREHLRKSLETLDCNAQEIEVFLKLFASNGLKASELSERTGIKRVKTYEIIQSLLDKNLIQELPNNKIKKFKTADLNHIKLLLNEKIKQLKETTKKLESSIPKLNKSVSAFGHHTQVKFYQKADVPRLLDHIIKTYDFKAIYNPLLTFEKNRKVMQEYLNNIEGNPNSIQEIVSCENRQIQQMFLKVKNPKYRAKLLDSNIKFDTDMILYDEKVFFGSYNGQSAIVISDPDIYSSLIQLFNKLWKDL